MNVSLSVLYRQLLLWLLIAPILACGPAARWNVTPTPTKTATPLKPLSEIATATATVPLIPSPTAVEIPPTPTSTPVPPTNTPIPVEEPAAASADEFNTDEAPPQAEEQVPPTNTPAPPPTNTPVPPPPPPTNTPAPPPPTNTPAPPPPPSNQAPTVIIELPRGDTYGIGDEVELIITVRDPDGVGAFSWGVFTENKTALIGGDENCHNATECRIEENFNTQLPGAFQIGVEAKDSKGEGIIELAQLYVG